ncbi:MAG TPA: hypothetical protein DD632_03770 [Oribacterium sp.]|nr:hypothetical protein [Oribacterium sp.]
MALTVQEILHEVDLMRPNAVDAALKLKFLNEIEAEVFDLYLEFLPAKEVIKNSLEARTHFWEVTAKNEENVKRTFTVATAQEGGTDIGDPLNMGLSIKKPREVWKFIPYDDSEGDAVVLLDDRFSGVYTSYVKAKIDYLEDETENYMNDAAMHEAEKTAWLSWMTRTHEHRQPEVKGL